MQFDFFNDSHQVVLRNAVIDALVQADAQQATVALQALVAQYPDDFSVNPMQTLINALQTRSTQAFASHAELAVARTILQGDRRLAADRAMGAQNAAVWLQACWLELAQRAAALPYHAEHPQDHAAPLYLEARQWQAAQDAVDGIASWRKIPAPLSWMLQARLPLQGLTACWGLLAELAWLAPQRLHEVLEQIHEPQLHLLLRTFSQVFEGQGNAEDLAWLPAWLLIERPALASELTSAQPGQHTASEQAMRTMLHLLGYERQGQHNKVVQCRKTLRDLNPELFALYLQAR